MKKYLLTLCLISLQLWAWSTHNRAGEITYEHVGGYTYRIRITTYTKQSAIADRNSLKIRWGDEPLGATENDLDSLFRTAEILNVANDVKRNEYVGYHTYSGPGTFVLSVEDPNRNAGVLNINNGDPGTPEADKTSTSVMAVFAIRSVLVIRPGENGHNNSIQFLNPPIQDACAFQPWIHNPVAFDSTEGDQLVFALVPCLGSNAQPLDTWESPTDYTDNPNDVFTIDPQTGDITWNTPLVPGEYNIAFEVREYRHGIFVGSVERDMQITVVSCGNVPPELDDLADYCITANQTLSFTVNYSDPNGPVNQVSVVALGGPMTDVEHLAAFDAPSHQFSWSPRCEEVRLQPYYVSFFATDQGAPPLTDVETVSITVVAPPVENPVANANGDVMDLNWDPTPCLDAFSSSEIDDVKYLVYRRNGLYGFEPDPCEVGVPQYTGYTYIGETVGVNSTAFADTSVNFGGVYCYMVVTVWPDGALSYASEEFCDTVNKEVPVMTKVSIGFTGVAPLGVDTVMWSKPSDMDTLLYPGPYTYKLYFREGASWTQIHETTPFTFLDQGDTTFVHTGTNTQDSTLRYRTEIWGAQGFITTSSSATSEFLILEPGDEVMNVIIEAQVPWTNQHFEVYRKDPGSSEFIAIGESDVPVFQDTTVVNNQEYCYKVLVTGSYEVPNVMDPIQNWSQEACAIPYDQTPPCPPTLAVDSDCPTAELVLSWMFEDSTCAQDVAQYQIYRATTDTSDFALVETIQVLSDTSYAFIFNEPPVSIAGCYAVTASDSLSLWPDGELHQNESAFSNVICLDNCPLYFLPNLFTPNGDDRNDLFQPIDWRYVESVDMKIYNRWGNVVFETTDPEILWDGREMKSDTMCADGAYYYVIRVNTIRLSGIVPEQFSGAIQLLDGSNSNQQGQ